MMDVKFMQRALELAKKGIGSVDPNPLVGAVIVKNGRIIGEGLHERFGGPHAEVNAFASAEESCEGAEMYVTLEPCAHYGKTPPCALAVIEHGIKKVYIGMTDPNPKVAGKGIQMLRSAGIEVVVGVLEKECRELNVVFLKHITTGLPYVVMKSAMSLDGKIACFTGDSKWISCPESRLEVQSMRNSLMGIMVGINTVLADDPLLTCRLNGGRDPYRVIVDTSLKLPIAAKVIGSDGKCIVACVNGNEKKAAALTELGVKVIVTPEKNGKVDLVFLAQKLGELGINGILLEGGGTLAFSAIESGIVDRVVIYIAPKIIGGMAAKTPVEGAGFAQIAGCVFAENMQVRQLGTDIVISADIRKRVQ